MISGGNATRVALAVSDMDRAVRFYVETLGFKLRARSGDEKAEVDAGNGLVLQLHRVAERMPRSHLFYERAPRSGRE